ncbi:MAG: hypothetical protein EPO07_08160 [Verrucomicrobia bacterium]|nr:MAG: hypothetical protein EPO07_08160 [Verrucomicrobiota bacterium]
MEFETVKAWLTRHTRHQIRNRWLLAALGLALLPLATVTGGILIFGLLRVITHDSTDPRMDVKCFWITLGIIPVMFLINLLIPQKREPEKYYHEDSAVDDSLVDSYVHRRKVQARFLLWIILTGPRLLSWSLFSFREISRLKKQDTHGCAAVLWLLMVKRSKVTYENIPLELDWVDVEATIAQLRYIPGVLFPKTPPAGVSLSDDLRTAIRTGAPI